MVILCTKDNLCGKLGGRFWSPHPPLIQSAAAADMMRDSRRAFRLRFLRIIFNESVNRKTARALRMGYLDMILTGRLNMIYALRNLPLALGVLREHVVFMRWA